MIRISIIAAPAAALLALAGPALAGDPSETQVDAAQQRMVACLKRLPTPQDGPWNAVEEQVRRRIAVCGKDYLTLLEQSGETAEGSGDLAFYGAIQKLGCRVANIDLDEFRHIPENLRMTTCSEERFVPSKAKWWAVIYDASRVSSVSGPYDDIGQCADSDKALANVSTARCELSAVRPQ